MSTLRFSLPVLLLLFSACSTLQPSVPLTDWQTHQNALLSHNSWQLQGRLNIRTDNESSTVSIDWQQQNQQFMINMNGTLGLGATQISGDAQRVSVEKSGEAPISANTLEEISQHYLGYEFPASALHYWVKGIPTPDNKDLAVIELNEDQRLKRLTQTDAQNNQWQLEYDRYQLVDGILLPGRIKMQHPSYRLTFIIRQWQLTSEITSN